MDAIKIGYVGTAFTCFNFEMEGDLLCLFLLCGGDRDLEEGEGSHVTLR